MFVSADSQRMNSPFRCMPPKLRERCSSEVATLTSSLPMPFEDPWLLKRWALESGGVLMPSPFWLAPDSARGGGALSSKTTATKTLDRKSHDRDRSAPPSQIAVRAPRVGLGCTPLVEKLTFLFEYQGFWEVKLFNSLPRLVDRV